MHITVAELIERLKKFSPDQEVVVSNTKTEFGFKTMKIEDVSEGVKGGMFVFINASREDEDE
ncbi:hypothetical protein LJR153_007355 [Paenibacillus sp. LjRoot153]|uniref:hypothetical protein n=1 Tax=Paenibacillus sp. LjRoot153 TaxID=3342270 RepID=UPI003ECE2EEA